MRSDGKAEEVLAAAIKLFAEKGVAETSIREVAIEAGVREQTVYNHFENKDGLLTAIVGELGRFHEEYAYQRWDLAKYRALAEQGTSPVDAVLAFNILRFPEEKKKYYTDVYAVVLREQFNSPQVRAAAVKLFFEDNFEYNRNMLCELHRTGYIDCDDPEMVARVFAETVYSYACGYILGYGENTAKFRGPSMDALLRRLLEIHIRPVVIKDAESGTAYEPLYRRERIDALLDAIWERGEHTAVITAAAGYGKTTAVQLYLEMAAARDHAMIHWQQSAGKDSLGVRFWESFCNSLDRTNPPLAARLMEIGFPEDLNAFSFYLSIITSYMDKTHMHYLVFDNFQDASPDVRKFIERSIARLPEMSRFIIISREMPDFETYHFGRIKQEALCFTQEEIRGLYAVRGVKLSDAMAEAVWADSKNGWAYFLSSLLSMIHMGGEMELDAEDYAIALKAAQSDTYDYLQNAVFVKLSPRVQKAVAMMGGAASVPARLFDAYVVAEEKSALAVLLKYNPMNDTYDAQPPAEEFLRAKFEALSEESVRRGWHLLANWYAERSAPAMAARYYVKARDWAAVRGVILTMPITMSDATAQYFLDAVREAIESGGEEASADYSFLKNALYPRLLYSLRRNDEAEAAAVAANKWLERCGQPYAHFQIMLNYAIIGMARLRRMLVTDREDCMDYFKKAHDEFLRCPPETIMPLKLCSQAVLNTYVCYIGANAKPGALERCFAIADNVIQYLSEPLGGFLYGVEELVRAEAAYYLGNLDEAKIRAASAITKASEKGQYDVIAHAKGYLAAIHIAEGDAKEVLSIMRWYDEIVNNTQYYNRSSARDYYISWLFAHLGLPELVCDWIKNSVIPQNSHLRELDVRTRSAYLMDNGEWESALAVLNTNLPPTQIYLLYAVSIEVYKAWCYMELGDALRATEALKKVYHLAAPHQIVMQFIRCGAATVRLLDKYRQAAGIPADWATDISERAALYEKRKAFVAKAVRKFYGDGQETVKLTRREAAVLKDLCCDMTYAEIAASQGVSVNAIKQAQKSLYMKLDVSSRAEAVRMAQQERLV